MQVQTDHLRSELQKGDVLKTKTKTGVDLKVIDSVRIKNDGASDGQKMQKQFIILHYPYLKILMTQRWSLGETIV